MPIKKPAFTYDPQAIILRFVPGLLKWNRNSNKRQMPWKGEKDPYRIWLSEIILQQTRVEQGLKYYENFIKTFPDVFALAQAPEEKIFKQWEGLGYYSRCRNLIHTARFIVEKHKGRFPSSYMDIIQLKGIGPYTAAAIGSFAYNLPYAVLDGNVYRVLSRIFDIDTPVDNTEGKKKFTNLSQNMLPLSKAGEYNQAIMDFGAIICKPVPDCHTCFFNKYCLAYLQAKQLMLPVKEKKTKIKERWINYIVLKHKDKLAIKLRKDKDIWQGLFEFLAIETDRSETRKYILQVFQKEYGIRAFKPLHFVEEKSQKLSHQFIRFKFIIVELDKKEKIKDFTWIPVTQLSQFPFARTVKRFIDENFS